MEQPLALLYRDDYLVAINKPSGLLVHRSPIDRHETRFALQLLRDQLGQRVYPLHRLDKPTSGVLLFGLDAGTARLMGNDWQAGTHKSYLAVVRGWLAETTTVNHPLKEELDKIADKHAQADKPAQPALTDIHCLAQVELPYPVDKYPQARYSLARCQPHTGRKHQIRRHLKHISHPIIGDAKHGKSSHNRFFQEQFGCRRLLLHADSLSFVHPVSEQMVTISAPLTDCMGRLITELGWGAHLPTWEAS
ncbi:tRNA pseudouridine(65) synthase TruC [Halioxenophilus sp. WMMB6]|uniref:tRNA pseudouridine(65) synthase TruC n=1 Tax=Halioxenophilus sp. WMMB6 TaxID=3073815 RepID=UPI00295EDE2E|nr:tRNA pseudouridine(65) synthase TruC [Halioxenophilus sp. WMMB6]